MALVSGCSSQSEDFEILPTPPSLTLTGSTVSPGDPFRLHATWTAADHDGIVTGYRIAVDPPPEFSEAELGSPIADDPTISEIFLPGTNGGPDRTRVSKDVGGRTVTFDWIHTQETERTFTLTTPDTETDANGNPTGRFTGMHAIYIRAVDNDGLRSVPARIAATAETVTPSAVIASPRISARSLVTGREISVVPHGNDPDNPRGPSGYRYKLITTTKEALQTELLDAPALDEFADPSEWIEISALSPRIELSLRDDIAYYFAVVAVDEAGPVEPFLELGRNVFGFTTSSSVRGPSVSISEPALGALQPAAGEASLAEVSNTTSLRFTVHCSAESYGGVCEGIRWGVDLENPDQEDGWSPWTNHPIVPDVLFTDPGPHSLYVQVRDDLGRHTTERFRFTSIRMSFENEVLWVDDARNVGTPSDPQNDAFWATLFEGSGRFPDGFAKHEVHGDGDFNRPATHPSLELLGQHRLLVWNVIANNHFNISSLLHATRMTPNMAMYLRGGGTLWIDGYLGVAAMDLHPAGRSDLSYPKILAPGDFAWDLLKMRTDNVTLSTGPRDRDRMWSALPWSGEDPVYPPLTISPEKVNRVQFALGGIHLVEVFPEDLTTRDEAFRGQLERVYGYGAAGPILFEQSSPFHQRLAGYRWHDPDPARTQGRIQYFGFPMYYFETTQAQETFNRSIDWFREEWEPGAQ